MIDVYFKVDLLYNATEYVNINKKIVNQTCNTNDCKRCKVSMTTKKIKDNGKRRRAFLMHEGFVIPGKSDVEYLNWLLKPTSTLKYFKRTSTLKSTVLLS